MEGTYPKELMGEVTAKANLKKHSNTAEVFFMPRVGNFSPKVSVEITTNDEIDQRPRSFRTDNTYDTHRLIIALCKAFKILVNDKVPYADARAYLIENLKEDIKGVL